MNTTASFTTEDRTTTRHHTGGGQEPTVTDYTDILVGGQVVFTITWVAALLRRMEREGWTKQDYIERIAARYTGGRA